MVHKTTQAQALLSTAGLNASRIAPKRRLEAERRMQRYGMRQWLMTHSLVAVPRVELSQTRKASLKECFDMLDADASGSIDFGEASVAVKALGISMADMKEALAFSDRNGDGELNFEEFCQLIATAEAAHPEGDASNHSTDSFPFALIANSYNISKLIDSYNPALKDAISTRGMASSSSLPVLGVSQTLSSSPQTTSETHFRVPKGTHSNSRGALPPIIPHTSRVRVRAKAPYW